MIPVCLIRGSGMIEAEGSWGTGTRKGGMAPISLLIEGMFPVYPLAVSKKWLALGETISLQPER